MLYVMSDLHKLLNLFVNIKLMSPSEIALDFLDYYNPVYMFVWIVMLKIKVLKPHRF